MNTLILTLLLILFSGTLLLALYRYYIHRCNEKGKNDTINRQLQEMSDGLAKIKEENSELFNEDDTP
jgi:hypothetical protein